MFDFLFVFVSNFLFSFFLFLDHGSYLGIDLLDIFLDDSDFFTFDLLLLSCVQGCFLSAMYFFELHVIIYELLESSILLLGTIFWFDHALEVLVVFKFIFHFLDLLLGFTNLLKVTIEFILFLSQDLIFRWLPTLIDNLLSLFYLDCLFDKAFQLLDDNKHHITKLYVLGIEGLDIFLGSLL